jgi:hypothetical protein
MDVLFFPFSHVDDIQRDTLAAFFSHFWFVPLTSDLDQDPHMVPLVETQAASPVFTPDDRLKQVLPRVAAWLDWAALHQGNERNLKTLIRDNPYFTEDASPFAIQSELRARIRQGVPDTGPDPVKSDPMLFLAIARITDQRNEAVGRDLARLEKKRAALFSRLRGDMEQVPAGSLEEPVSDPGEAMTRQRIGSWSACARELALFQIPAPRVLATTSPAVYDMVAANATRVINALDIDAVKLHEDGCVNRPGSQRQVLGLLERLMSHPLSVTLDQARMALATDRDGCRLTGRIQAGVFEGPDLEKNLNLPPGPLVVCQVTLKPEKQH